jgi:hypothetical protein
MIVLVVSVAVCVVGACVVGCLATGVFVCAVVDAGVKYCVIDLSVSFCFRGGKA